MVLQSRLPWDRIAPSLSASRGSLCPLARGRSRWDRRTHFPHTDVCTSGNLELRLDQVTAEGRVAQRLAVPLAQMAAEPAPGQDYIVQHGNSLWQIARRAYGAGPRYVTIYSANPNQIRDPDRIYPGQVFKLPKS